jgi:hypothetical protein
LVLVVASVLVGASTCDGSSLQLRSQHSLESKAFQRALLSKYECNSYQTCTTDDECCPGLYCKISVAEHADGGRRASACRAAAARPERGTHLLFAFKPHPLRPRSAALPPAAAPASRLLLLLVPLLLVLVLVLVLLRALSCRPLVLFRRARSRPASRRAPAEDCCCQLVLLPLLLLLLLLLLRALSCQPLVLFRRARSRPASPEDCCCHAWSAALEKALEARARRRRRRVLLRRRTAGTRLTASAGPWRASSISSARSQEQEQQEQKQQGQHLRSKSSSSSSSSSSSRSSNSARRRRRRASSFRSARHTPVAARERAEPGRAAGLLPAAARAARAGGRALGRLATRARALVSGRTRCPARLCPLVQASGAPRGVCRGAMRHRCGRNVQAGAARRASRALARAGQRRQHLQRRAQQH